jgi:hypothetical protein
VLRSAYRTLGSVTYATYVVMSCECDDMILSKSTDGTTRSEKIACSLYCRSYSACSNSNFLNVYIRIGLDVVMKTELNKLFDQYTTAPEPG